MPKLYFALTIHFYRKQDYFKGAYFSNLLKESEHPGKSLYQLSLAQLETNKENVSTYMHDISKEMNKDSDFNKQVIAEMENIKRGVLMDRTNNY